MRGRVVMMLLLLGVTGLAGAACDSDGAQGHTLPPNDFERLSDIFDPQLKPLGLHLTRGALIDRSGGGYRESANGHHLAVYVEPTGEYTLGQYAVGIVSSARVFLPEVFERWKDLRTFDVCQEPLPGVDDRKEPPPVTQLYVSRAEVKSIRWKTVTLPELLAAKDPARESFTLYVAPEVMSDPGWPALSQPG